MGLGILVSILLALKALNPSQNNEWQSIARKKLLSLKRGQHNTLESQKQLIIELDKLLDFCLKNKKLNGDSMGDRLKSSRSFFSKDSYNKIWEAHKVRNKLVHEIDFRITIESLKRHNNELKNSIENLLK